MANPTQAVKLRTVDWDGISYGKWPLKGTATTYQTGELLGIKADGYAYHFDDSAPMRYLGVLKREVALAVPSGSSDGDNIADYVRPALLEYPLASGTASRVNDIGKAVFAVDAQSVQIGASGLTYGNRVGVIADVIPSSSGNAGLTGSRVLIRPDFWTAPEVANFNYNAPADTVFFTADKPIKVVAITVRVVAAGTDAGAVTAVIRKVPDATATASGTALHSSTVNLKGTANTNQVLTLSTTQTDLMLIPGDSIGVDVTGTTTAATGNIMVSYVAL